jgi:hypothetical protein
MECVLLVFGADNRSDWRDPGAPAERHRAGGSQYQVRRNVWRGRIQDSTKTGEVYEKYVTDRLLAALKAHLELKNLAPDDFVFYRSELDRRPLDPDYIRREILYPALQRGWS